MAVLCLHVVSDLVQFSSYPVAVKMEDPHRTVGRRGCLRGAVLAGPGVGKLVRVQLRAGKVNPCETIDALDAGARGVLGANSTWPLRQLPRSRVRFDPGHQQQHDDQ